MLNENDIFKKEIKIDEDGPVQINTKELGMIKADNIENKDTDNQPKI